MNATFDKFGWPQTAIAELEHWCVMLRVDQPTLGSLVLACKEPAQAFGDVSAEGCAELSVATKAIEEMLSAAIGYDKINYLMLMMVDPDVHFHVIPRYEETKSFEGFEVADAGWPGPPALGAFKTLDDDQRTTLIAHLKAHWRA